MDIKRLNNGAASWPRDAATEPATAKPQADAAGALDALPAGALDGLRAQYKRADLSTPKFDSLLRQSIDALLDSAAASGSSMPSTVRAKAADFLAADPLFAGRVRLYWEKNLN
jgi:hypothetical protein